MSMPDERTVVANGLRHHVLVWNDGAKETFVLCHGFLDQAWAFARLAEHLVAGGYRVVAFDWRGHGETEHVGRGGYYHFANYVLDMHELLPRIAPDPLHLVGHSMGGTAAALYAGTHPEGCRTLALVEGMGPKAFEGDAAEKMTDWLASMDRFRQRQRQPSRGVADMVQAVKRMRVQNPDIPVDLAYFLAEKATVANPDGSRLRWRFDALHRTTSPSPFVPGEFASFLRRIAAPTLIIQGSRGFRTADHAVRVAAIPNGIEVEMDDVGHMVHWMRPRELSEQLIRHARQHSARPESRDEQHR